MCSHGNLATTARSPLGAPRSLQRTIEQIAREHTSPILYHLQYTMLRLGNRAFCVAGPVAWNSLPLDIRSVPALSTFKNMLKTHLFSRSNFTDYS